MNAKADVFWPGIPGSDDDDLGRRAVDLKVMALAEVVALVVAKQSEKAFGRSHAQSFQVTVVLTLPVNGSLSTERIVEVGR